MKQVYIIVFVAAVLAQEESENGENFDLRCTSGEIYLLEKLLKYKQKQQEHELQLQDLRNQNQALQKAIELESRERCRSGYVSVRQLNCTNSCANTSTIVFNPPFSRRPPVTMAGFSSLDTTKDVNLRISFFWSNVTTSSASLTVRTWADSHVFWAGVSWIACPRL